MPRKSLKFTSAAAENAFNLINFKENVGDSNNLKRIANFLEISNPNNDYKTHIKSVNNLMSEATNNKIAYKEVAIYLYNRFSKSIHVCNDAVFVHISAQYFCKDDAPYGGAFWLDADKKKRVDDYARKTSTILCGKIAPNFNIKLLPQINLKYQKLNKVEANYTILFFWKINCKLCEKEGKILANYYANLSANKGIEIIGIAVDDNDIDKSEQQIVSSEMNWINGVDVGFAITKLYNINTVSCIYLLAKEKRIIMKDVLAKDVVDYINSN